ncbi:MAG: tyrosine-type recombinase/integrase [Neisseria sp.]|nr:tyrosine-type recombinase/integrase [Neisseria sp.]
MNREEFFSFREDFFTRLRQSGMSEHTQLAYRHDMEQLSDLIKDLPEENITRNTFVYALKRLSAQGLHPRSMARKLSVWRRYVADLIEKGCLNDNPLAGLKAPKAPSRLPKAVDAEKLNRIFDAPEEADNVYTRRDAAVFELLYGSGLRVAEAVALDLHHIDWEEGLVHVSGKGGKERVVPLGRQSVAALQAYLPLRVALAGENALFTNRFGTRITDRRLRQCLNDWTLRHGADRHLSPHMLRHSFAGHVLQSSRNIRAVQELLGHSRLSTTQIYTKLDFDHLAQVYDEAHPRAKKKADK